MIDWSAVVIGPCMQVFGQPVTFAPAYGPPFCIRGVFDEAYLEVTPLGRGGAASETFSLGSPGSITTEMPVLGVQLSQFRRPPQQGDTLVIDATGQRYTVKEVRIDSHGGAKLLLNEV